MLSGEVRLTFYHAFGRPLYIDKDGNSNPGAALFFITFIVVVGNTHLDTASERESHRSRQMQAEISIRFLFVTVNGGEVAAVG